MKFLRTLPKEAPIRGDVFSAITSVEFFKGRVKFNTSDVV